MHWQTNKNSGNRMEHTHIQKVMHTCIVLGRQRDEANEKARQQKMIKSTIHRATIAQKTQQH